MGKFSFLNISENSVVDFLNASAPPVPHMLFIGTGFILHLTCRGFDCCPLRISYF